jgi:hypothetical protein
MLGEKKLYIQKNFFETISSEQDGSMVLHTHTHTHTHPGKSGKRKKEMKIQSRRQITSMNSPCIVNV